MDRQPTPYAEAAWLDRFSDKRLGCSDDPNHCDQPESSTPAAVLLGMAQWSEQRDATAFEKILDVSFGIETLPSWFPTEAFATTIRRSLPHVEPAEEDSSARYDDDVDRLASQVLWLAES
jgi:hypothetical protein